MKLLTSIIIFILSLSLISAVSIRAYYDDVTVLTLANDRTIRDAQIKTYIPTTDSFGRSQRVDIRRDETIKVFIDHDQELESGIYPIVVLIEDEDGRVAKKGTWIIVP